LKDGCVEWVRMSVEESKTTAKFLLLCGFDMRVKKKTTQQGAINIGGSEEKT
jgi:hypothetical protein